MRPAIFLDRDGTLIKHVHHLCDPADVELIEGAAQAVRRIRHAGFACVLVTNQSVIGRGMLTLEGLERVHDRMHKLLANEDAQLDGVYFCPDAPKGNDRTSVMHRDRKPGAGMLIRAAEELELVLEESWMVGDMISDVLAGRNAGCRATILVQTGLSSDNQEGHDAIEFVSESLRTAVDLILAEQGDTAASSRQVS